jgi:hypothetical protein
VIKAGVGHLGLSQRLQWQLIDWLFNLKAVKSILFQCKTCWHATIEASKAVMVGISTALGIT